MGGSKFCESSGERYHRQRPRVVWCKVVASINRMIQDRKSRLALWVPVELRLAVAIEHLAGRDGGAGVFVELLDQGELGEKKAARQCYARENAGKRHGDFKQGLMSPLQLES